MIKKKRNCMTFSLSSEAISYIESLPRNQRSRFVDTCILQGMAAHKLPDDNRWDDLLADIKLITEMANVIIKQRPERLPELRRNFQYAEVMEGETILTAWRHQYNYRKVITDEDERAEDLLDAWVPHTKGVPNYGR